jgi:hypothetical protein
MTESAKKLWSAVDVEINDFIGDGAEAYCLTDKIVDEVRGMYTAMNLTSRIGLKRRIGKVLLARGYTKTSTSPPTWVLHPPVPMVLPIDQVPEVHAGPQPVPMWVQDIYISLMQSLVIIEKEYPGIEKAV